MKGGKAPFYAAPELHDNGEPSGASDMWAVGLTMFEAIAGIPAFDPRLGFLSLVKKMMSEERPVVPAIASPQLKSANGCCWTADPMRRATAQQVAEEFATLRWNLVRGADRKVVEAFLARFPLDASATKEEVLAAPERSQKEVAELMETRKGEREQIRALSAAVARLKGENAQLPALRAENARLKEEVMSLRKKLAASPLPAPVERPVAAQAGQRGGEFVLSDGTRHPLPPVCGEWTEATTAALLGDKDKVKSISFPEGVTAIGKRGCTQLRALESVTFPSSVVSIVDGAFSGCRALLRVLIPGCTEVGVGSFEGCYSLLEVVITAGCKSIGNGAFYGCYALTQVVISEGCVEIGTGTFCSCSGLTGVGIPRTCRTIGPEAFRNCTKLVSVRVPKGCTIAGGEEPAFRDSPTQVEFF
jgi:hypothetical protein